MRSWFWKNSSTKQWLCFFSKTDRDNQRGRKNPETRSAKFQTLDSSHALRKRILWEDKTITIYDSCPWRELEENTTSDEKSQLLLKITKESRVRHEDFSQPERIENHNSSVLRMGVVYLLDFCDETALISRAVHMEQTVKLLGWNNSKKVSLILKFLFIFLFCC